MDCDILASGWCIISKVYYLMDIDASVPVSLVVLGIVND